MGLFIDEIYVETGFTASTIVVNSTGGNVVLTGDTNATLKTITFVVEGGGSAVTTGGKGIVQVPYSGTVINWKLVGDVSTTTTLDVWKASGSIPTNANSMISTGTKPSLTTATVNNGTVDWAVKSIDINDVLRMEVESNNNATYLCLVLTVKMF